MELNSLDRKQYTQSKLMDKKNREHDGLSGGEKKHKHSSEINCCDNASNVVLNHFYERLNKLNESSGLSLVFNFRETKLDLRLLYNEVIKKGGFYQVTKIGKWDEVASASNLKSNNMSMSAAHLQKVYETLLLQYELLYSHQKLPEQAVNTWPAYSYSGVGSTGKRKHSDVSSPLSTVAVGDANSPGNENKSFNGRKTLNQNSTTKMSTPSNSNIHAEVIKLDSDAPLKPRTGYQIFLRLETQRLKMIHGESSSTTHNLRDMATEAWRSLSEINKRPFIEAGKIDKERYDKEMASYKQRQEERNTKGQSLLVNQIPNTLNFSTSSKTDDVYHVSMEPDSEKFLTPDKCMVKLAIEAMKKAESNDPLFHMDWDGGSMDIPY